MDHKLEQNKTSSWSRLKRHFTESFSGELLAAPRSPGAPKGDEWRDASRSNAYRYIAATIAAIVLPLAIHNFYVGALWPAVGAWILLAFLMLDIALISVGRRALLSPFTVMLVSVALFFVSTARSSFKDPRSST